MCGCGGGGLDGYYEGKRFTAGEPSHAREGISMDIELSSDGSSKKWFNFGRARGNPIKGEYSVSGHTVTIENNNGVVTTYTISPNKEVLTGEDGDRYIKR